MFVTNWDAAHCVISNFDTHYDNLSPEDDDYEPGKLWADDDDLPLAGGAVDLEGMHVFYPEEEPAGFPWDTLPDNTAFRVDEHHGSITLTPVERKVVNEVPVCGFEGDTNPLESTIEYMELDTRLCPVTSVLKPMDVIAGSW